MVVIFMKDGKIHNFVAVRAARAHSMTNDK